jgi:hypothetical protein
MNSSSMTLIASSVALMLAACTSGQPDSSIPRGVSGVTSSSGGGMVPANFSTFDPNSPTGRNFDTGNMAYPEPLPQGNLGTTRVQR